GHRLERLSHYRRERQLAAVLLARLQSHRANLNAILTQQGRRERRLTAAFHRAFARYSPRPYSGNVELFQSTGFYNARALHEVPRGWSRLVGGQVRYHLVPGTHLTMITEPHVQVLAQELSSCLDAACDATVAAKHHQKPAR